MRWVAWPVAARAQQTAMPVVAFTRSTTFAGANYLVTAFRDGLKEAGFVEGRNVLIELHAADDQVDRLQALTAELIRRPVLEFRWTTAKLPRHAGGDRWRTVF